MKKRRVLFGDKEAEICLIIYDKDGTLLDFYGTDVLPMILRSELIAKKLDRGEDFAKKLQRRFGYEPESRNINHGSPALLGSHRETRIVFATMLYQEGYNFREMLDLVDRVYHEVWSKTDWSKTITVVHEVRAAIENQHRQGLRIAVATNDDTETAKTQLKKAGLLDLIDLVLGSDSVGVSKPDPSLLIEICRRLEVKPSDAVIVGDSIADMMCGRNAGLGLVVGVTEGSNTPKEALAQEANVILDSIRSIKIL